MEEAKDDRAAWPVRTWVLALIGALGGLAIDWLVPNGIASGHYPALRFAAATFIGVAALILGHSWVRGHVGRAILLAVIGGAIIALVFLWNGTLDQWSAGGGWRIVAALLSVFVLVPLFQAAWERHAGFPDRSSLAAFTDWVRRAISYPAVHDHAWTNVLTAGLSVLFAFAFWLMLNLIGRMFLLIDIGLLLDVLRKEPMVLAILGAGIGASTGLLRERRRIIASLQGVAMMVLRIAAPVLAVALVLFVAALPFTGLAPLWHATRDTTPIVLVAAVLALLLANSVIGDGPDGESHATVYRWAAIALALALMPLVAIALMSTRLRVDQYGWTPERLWAATYIFMACLTAATYAVAVLRGRRRWAERLRGANLWLALGICVLGLVLSTPLVDFDAIASRDQLARLADGRIAVDKFDYRALEFGFGEPGRRALATLAKSGPTAASRNFAVQAQRLKNRWDDDPAQRAQQVGSELDARLTVLPAKVQLPAGLRQHLANGYTCAPGWRCTVYYRAGQDWALAVATQPDCRSCRADVSLVTDFLEPQAPTIDATKPASKKAKESSVDNDALARAIRAGKVDVREERLRRVYIDGKPFGETLPSAPQTP